MKERKTKLEIIKNTILTYIINEVKSKLKSKNVEEKKTKEFLDLVEKKTRLILNSLDEEVILPKKEVENEKEFREHILHVLGKIRPRLVKEMRGVKL